MLIIQGSLESGMSIGSDVYKENSALKALIEELNQKISSKNQIFAKTERMNKEFEAENI